MNPRAKERMRRIFPGAPDWLRYSESQRQAFVEIQIIANRGAGFVDADQLAFQDFGYESSDEYWFDRLSEPMKTKDFLNLLIKHLRSIKESGIGPALMYERAFDLAQDMGEPWFFDGPRNESLMVRPLEAARWLFSMPRQRHLVPQTLAELLSGDQKREDNGAVGKVEHRPRKRGRPPIVREQSAIAMRAALVEGALTRERLESMTEKEMEDWFGASRDTLRSVRDSVLSESVGNTIPDKYSTNDK